MIQSAGDTADAGSPRFVFPLTAWRLDDDVVVRTPAALETRRKHAGVRVLDRHIAEQLFTRVAGAPLIGGNQVRILKDAAENYPAWLEAI